MDSHGEAFKLDQALISAKLIPTSKMKALFGNSFSIKLIEALNLCVNSAEDFYKSNQLSNAWIPPLEGFHISEMSTSVSQNIEEGLYRAAMHCSSYCVSAELDNSNTETQTNISAPEHWRKDITQAVIKARADFANNFGKSVTIQGSVGVPLKFGFISPNYAAHFDAISTPQMIQQGLERNVISARCL